VIRVIVTAKRITTVASVWLLAGSSAFAHPGHGRDGGDFSILHYLTEPVAVFAAYATGIVRSRSGRRS
jgi:hypothetical protein